jgi:hypothetical protein
MKGTALHALYALVFVLLTSAAAAQTLETSLAPYFIDDVDCSAATPGSSTITSKVVASRPPIKLLCEAMLLHSQGADIGARKDGEDVPVGTIEPGRELPTVGMPGAD